MNMKKIKQCLAAGLCVLLMSNGTVFVAAASAVDGPMGQNRTPAQKMGVSEEDYQRYMDNRLEYAEIDALVHFFNPGVANGWKDYRAGIDEITMNISELEAGQRSLSELAENAKSAGDIESFGVYTAQEKALDQTVKSLNRSKVSLGREVSIGNESLRNSERQVIHAVKSMMVNYLSLRKQMDLLQSGIAIREEMLAISKTGVDVGTSILQDAIRANSELAKNKADLETLRSNAESMRRTLITMLGWDVNAQPEIMDIRVEDFVNGDVIQAVDLEADIKSAIGNNYTLISHRRAKTSRNFTKKEAADVSEAQMEGNVRNDVTKKYQNMKTALLDYESKKTALQAGEMKANAAESKYRLGMLSRIRYNESALEYNRAKVNAEVSSLNLLLAYLEYQDAVRGSASAE